MRNISKIAIRNLLRYKRRTFLTSLLMVLGVVLVIVFSGVSGSFKTMMVGTITDSMLGHLQIHKKGYVSSIDNLPLHLNINSQGVTKLEGVLDAHDGIEAYSFRIKLGGMLSNYEQTTNIRLTAVYPDMESRTSPALVDRILDYTGSPTEFIQPGGLIVPENLAKGLSLKVGDDVALVATNQDGSVNGVGLVVSAIIQGLTGPSGRDGYLHIDDARTLLRIDSREINEVAIRLKDADELGARHRELEASLGQFKNKTGQPAFETHDWAKLSPFSTIATIVDLLIVTVKIVLIAIVLISILNIMMMSVYERVSEIGTLSAIGTLPSRVLGMFVAEGFWLGLVSTIIGNILGVLLLMVINLAEFRFSFGRMKNILLQTSINPNELLTVSLIVIGVTLLASLQPALRASRMEPVEALRHV